MNKCPKCEAEESSRHAFEEGCDLIYFGCESTARDRSGVLSHYFHTTLCKDRQISSQAKRIEVLENALKPFKEAAKSVDALFNYDLIDASGERVYTFGASDFYDILEALEA